MKPVMLGSIAVGDGHPPVFVAEIGSFFKRDVDRAFDFLQRVVEAGAPIFKTEILHSADTVLADTGLLHNYAHAHGRREEDYRTLIEDRVVPLPRYQALLERCHQIGIPFLASVFDPKGVDFLVEMKAAAIKLARNYVDHHVLIRYAAKTGLPIILDVGETYFSETFAAAEIVRAAGAPLILLHHPGPNPSPAAVHNMRLIETYKRTLEGPVGLSDHYRGDLMAYVAVALGANMVEKGVVDDPDAAEADIVSAVRFSELKHIQSQMKLVWESLGDGRDHTQPSRNLSARAGLVAAVPLRRGESMTMDKARWSWPPLGISSEFWPLIENARLVIDVPAGKPLTWADFGLVREQQ
jgi:sialic acid synthase SpsE